MSRRLLQTGSPSGTAGFVDINGYHCSVIEIDDQTGQIYIQGQPTSSTKPQKYLITGFDGVKTVFTLPGVPDANVLMVFINGELQQEGDSYSVVGNQLTLIQAPLVSDKCTVVF